ncbi:MAG TPA: right-handed parallel beta-helix repeat-containing protein [Gammaproteobacteria bacterium]|nr:right-handed parallel beta-helix repeat-containing protein [Gammaproteobacteria bacterium]
MSVIISQLPMGVLRANEGEQLTRASITLIFKSLCHETGGAALIWEQYSPPAARWCVSSGKGHRNRSYRRQTAAFFSGQLVWNAKNLCRTPNLPALLAAASFFLVTLSAEAVTFTSTRTLSGVNGLVSDGDTYNNTAGDWCLRIINSSNITVRNSTFTNCGRRVNATQSIYIENSSNITIDNNSFAHIGGGTLAFASPGRRTDNIKITNNLFKDRGLDYNPSSNQYWGAYVQFNGIKGAGNEVNYNQMADIPQLPHPDGPSCVQNYATNCMLPDVINLYESGGLSTSAPLLVVGNYIKNNSNWIAAAAIIIGDSAGTGNAGSYVTAQYNTVIDTAGVGIGIGGGSNSEILDNVIFGSSGRADSNVGLYVYKWRGSSDPAPCSGHSVRNNSVRWFNNEGFENPFYIPSTGGISCGSVDGFTNGDTNNWHANLNRCSKHVNTPAWRLDVDYAECS